jgi:hypothetical protein
MGVLALKGFGSLFQKLLNANVGKRWKYGLMKQRQRVLLVKRR